MRFHWRFFGILLFLSIQILSQGKAMENSEKYRVVGPIELDKGTLKEMEDSALSGNAKEAYNLYSYFLIDKNNQDEAFKWLAISAKAGFPAAQLNYAKMNLDLGLGDHDLAIKYLIEAYNSKECGVFSAAAAALGNIHMDKSSAMYDLQKAISYYEEAAEYGSSNAQSQLVQIYAKLKVPIDFQKAFFWDVVYNSGF